MSNRKEIIAKNIAVMLHDGDFVNLGIGIPTLVSNYLPEGMQIILHGENGAAGISGKIPSDDIFSTPERFLSWEKAHKGDATNHFAGHKDLVDPGGFSITLMRGGCVFDVTTSFAMSRGGHLDLAVLGAMQVDQEGNLANWMVPGKMVTGMGGAMDIVTGTKKVIVATTILASDGAKKLMKKCNLPLTALHRISTVVTEKCIAEIADHHFMITHVYPGVTKEEILSSIDGDVVFADKIGEMLI